MKNWITKKLGDCSIKFVDGDRSSRYPKRDEFVASGIPFLNAESINSGYVNLSKANFIAENKFSEIKKGRLEQNDLILTTRGNGVGKVAYFSNDKVDTGLINAQLLIVRAFGDLNAKYLYYYFSSCFFQGNIKNFVSGAAQPQIPIASLKSIEISYPILKAQQKIADILSAYDDLIENNRRRIQLLERSLHLLYKEWFVYLRFPSHEHSKIVDGIPEGWERKPLGSFITLNYGKSLQSDKRVSGNYPVYGSSGIIGTHIEPLVKGHGIIVGRKGNVGKVFWADSDYFPIDTKLRSHGTFHPDRLPSILGCDGGASQFCNE